MCKYYLHKLCPIITSGKYSHAVFLFKHKWPAEHHFCVWSWFDELCLEFYICAEFFCCLYTYWCSPIQWCVILNTYGVQSFESLLAIFKSWGVVVSSTSSLGVTLLCYSSHGSCDMKICLCVFVCLLTVVLSVQEAEKATRNQVSQYMPASFFVPFMKYINLHYCFF